jgi:hypothetical protein
MGWGGGGGCKTELYHDICLTEHKLVQQAYCCNIIQQMVQQAYSYVFLQKQILFREMTLCNVSCTTEGSGILTFSILRSKLKSAVVTPRTGLETKYADWHYLEGGERNTSETSEMWPIYMAISILAVTCRVRFKGSMLDRHGAHTIAGCDVKIQGQRACDVTHQPNFTVTVRYL